MENLTLIIPAKNESESLPSVLEEIKDYTCKKIIILESSDIETINSIKKYKETEKDVRRKKTYERLDAFIKKQEE